MRLLQEFLQLGASAIDHDDPVLSVDDLADQILEVLNYFRLGAVMCMGTMVGAYILTLFAVMSNLLYFYGMCHLLRNVCSTDTLTKSSRQLRSPRIRYSSSLQKIAR